MFGSRVGFSGTADLLALFPVRTNPRWRPPPSWKILNGHISATGRPIHFMFGYRVGFSGTADLMALFSIRTNSRWRPPPSWLISNGHILRNGSRSTYSAHHAVIFAIAQLSCLIPCLFSKLHPLLSITSLYVLFIKLSSWPKKLLFGPSHFILSPTPFIATDAFLQLLDDLKYSPN